MFYIHTNRTCPTIPPHPHIGSHIPFVARSALQSHILRYTYTYTHTHQRSDPASSYPVCRVASPHWNSKRRTSSGAGRKAAALAQPAFVDAGGARRRHVGHRRSTIDVLRAAAHVGGARRPRLWFSELFVPFYPLLIVHDIVRNCLPRSRRLWFISVCTITKCPLCVRIIVTRCVLFYRLMPTPTQFFSLYFKGGDMLSIVYYIKHISSLSNFSVMLTHVKRRLAYSV